MPFPDTGNDLLIGWAFHRRHPGGWGGDLRGPQAGLVRLLTLLQTGLTALLCSSLSGNELSQRWRLAYQKLFMEHSWRQIDEDILCLPSPPFCPLTDLSDSDILSSLNYNEITRTAALPLPRVSNEPFSYNQQMGAVDKSIVKERLGPGGQATRLLYPFTSGEKFALIFPCIHLSRLIPEIQWLGFSLSGRCVEESL